jgi:hypothetical protein
MTDEHRADKRFLLHVPVEITGVDNAGRNFAESARIENVSELGCCFSIQNAVRAGGVLGIEPLGPDGEHLPDEHPRPFAIIWLNRKGDRWTIGVKSIREDGLDNSGFPPNSSASETTAK